MWVGSDYGCCKQNEICPKFGHALIGKEVKRNEPPNHKFLGLKGKNGPKLLMYRIHESCSNFRTFFTQSLNSHLCRAGSEVNGDRIEYESDFFSRTITISCVLKVSFIIHSYDMIVN